MNERIEEKFERKFIEWAVEETLRRGHTKREFANYVFRDRSTPERTLQAVLKGAAPGKKMKPQRVTLAESYRIADYLGYKLPIYTAMIEGEIFRLRSAEPPEPQEPPAPDV
ncbi:MAG: hypothetical protein RBS57_19125 [Desulforhabdus sp.]|nr:hypothetical protein [Desulforhabdus sp.]